MISDKDVFSRIDDAEGIAALMQALVEPGAASLVLAKKDGEREHGLPVAVRVIEQGAALSLEVRAPEAQVRVLRRGAGFRLLASPRSGELRTSMLSAERFSYRDGRLLCRCAYPAQMELRQRRDTFRAALGPGMTVAVHLYRRGRGGTGKTVSGRLRDLSLEGCLLALPVQAVVDGDLYDIEMCFPDGSVFLVRGRPRHLRPDPVRGRQQAGFAFVETDRAQLRQLGFYVREIEREAARTVDGDRFNLQPSPLFSAVRGR